MRRQLATTLIALTLVGAFALAGLFLGSLAPSARAEAERPRVRVPPIGLGQFAYVENPVRSEQRPSRYLFLRTRGGALRVFEIPTSGERLTLPDRAWWRPGHLCRAFEPDFTTQQFLCHDAEAPAWVRDRYRWSLEGRSLYPEYVEDMPVVHGRVEADEFVIDPRG